MVSVALAVTPLNAPEIVEVVAAATIVVEIGKVADVAPAATVTEAGTIALVLVEASCTTVPLAGAGPLRMTVPTEGSPPASVDGFRVKLVREGGLIVRTAVVTKPPWMAVMVAGVGPATGVVVMVKVVVVAPAGIVTVLGTVALDDLELTDTTTPPVGAGPSSVRVPMEELPPVTVVGESVRLVKTGGSIVSVAVEETPPWVAVMVTGVDVTTGVVLTVKVPVVAPAATVTDTGTVALVELEPSVTTSPPVGAAPVNVTVPVEGLPPFS